jgi:flagellar protein FlgJ
MTLRRNAYRIFTVVHLMFPNAKRKAGKIMKIESIETSLAHSGGPKLADKLEQVFLEEMLRHCMPPSDGPFGGGAGEDQFAGFLTRHYAEILTTRLDLGLRLEGRGDA